MNRWQDLTDMEVSKGMRNIITHAAFQNLGSKGKSLAETLDLLSNYCSEFLIHAADVEGLCQGVDELLVESASHFYIV